MSTCLPGVTTEVDARAWHPGFLLNVHIFYLKSPRLTYNPAVPCNWPTMMLNALLAISAVVIRVGQGQSTTQTIPPLPSCAASCVVSVCNAPLPTDFNCFCDVDSGLNIEDCWSESCSPDDIGSAYVALNSVCCTFPTPFAR